MGDGLAVQLRLRRRPEVVGDSEVDTSRRQRADELVRLCLHHVDLDARIAIGALAEQGRQIVGSQGHEAADGHRPGDGLAVPPGLPFDIPGAGQQIPRLLLEPLSGGCQGQTPASPADEQLRLQIAFQVEDGRRHGGLRDVELQRSLRYRAALGGDQEVTELNESEAQRCGHTSPLCLVKRVRARPYAAAPAERARWATGTGRRRALLTRGHRPRRAHRPGPAPKARRGCPRGAAVPNRRSPSATGRRPGRPRRTASGTGRAPVCCPSRR